MKILYFDCFSGIDEEAVLGALMDLGVEKTYISEELSKSKLYSYENQNVIEAQQALRIINQSELNENIKMICTRIISKINSTYKRFEGMKLNEGVTGLSKRNLISIISTAACIDKIKPERIFSSSIEVGRGVTVLGEKVVPIPSPLTLEILKEIPIKNHYSNIEATSLIGAAIMSSLAESFTEDRDFLIKNTGYAPINGGIFSVYLVEQENHEIKYNSKEDPETGCLYDEQLILECNIDDMNPEIYDVVMKKLLKAGAADVYFTPIIMKKGRPAIKISVLCSKNQVKLIEEVLFRETSTFGIRRYKVNKTMLQRNFTKVKTKYGSVTVKRGFYRGEEIKAKPEHDECRKISEELEVPVIEVYKEVWKHL